MLIRGEASLNIRKDKVQSTGPSRGDGPGSRVYQRPRKVDRVIHLEYGKDVDSRVFPDDKADREMIAGRGIRGYGLSLLRNRIGEES
uniref:Uncharacterized protein n=1 Tax=Candidatus Kentrum sp. TC TaxID=2126339 RepID=A0A450Y8Z5_9GAMM|nr:MAG: hypothetical protein BECKTC1821D_GA0114238_100311 [Candidatus Kentron sp. TC]VFK54662.1 MAG: hypothetical protein BECKTC1821F_GA0114240_100594 [Candidatus Kentron sp. TC]